MASNVRVFQIFSRSVFFQIVALAAVITALVAKDGIRQVASENISNLTTTSGGALKFGKVDTIQAMLDEVVEHRADAYFSFALDASCAVVAKSGEVTDTERAALTALAQAAIETGERQTSSDGFMIAEHVVFGKKNTIVGAVATAWTPTIVMAQTAWNRNITIAVAIVIFAGLMLIFGMILKRRISNPLEELGAAMNLISAGNYDIEIPSRHREDEIGLIAASLDQMIEKLREGRQADQLRAKASQEQEGVVKQLTSSLQSLAEGDLSGELTEPFPSGYDGLRTNLNEAKRRLNEITLSVLESSNNVGQIATTSSGLAHRT